MIPRRLMTPLRRAARAMPVVAVTGPRQSGKTTLCRAAFADRPYVSLEPLDTREYATQDPRGFLDEYRDGAVLDEVQRVPSLFSYLQELVDEDPEPGRFILTGSEHFGLSEPITQSLAGRIALLHLLPPSRDELVRFPDPPADLMTSLWMGAYPRIHDRGLDPNRWLADYAATYIERDVRQVLKVGDLTAFDTFLRLTAGRTAQEENLSKLGADAGVTHPTARAWLSVLETSWLLFRLPPWHRNVRRRIVKAAKLHFVDSGLVCHLLGIRSPDQLRVHPLRGAVFETWVASEVLKARLHRGLTVDLFHLREQRGLEIDLLSEADQRVIAVEAKSGATVQAEFLEHLRRLAGELETTRPDLEAELRLVYGGDRRHKRSGVLVLPWSKVQSVAW